MQINTAPVAAATGTALGIPAAVFDVLPWWAVGVMAAITSTIAVAQSVVTLYIRVRASHADPIRALEIITASKPNPSLEDHSNSAG